MKSKLTLDWHINKSGLSNTVINDLLNLSGISSKYFKGVFPYDNLPENISQLDNFSIIVNIGLHFVTIYAEEKFVYYIDSLGGSINNVHVKSFLCSGLKRPIYFNKRQIQSLMSSHCGLYTALYILFMEGSKREKKLLSIKKLKFFSSGDLLRNDKLCVKYIKILCNNMIEINNMTT